MYVRHVQSVVDEVLAQSAQGVPTLRIARSLGINPTTVRRWLRTGSRRARHPPPCTDHCDSRLGLDPVAYAYILGMCLGDGHIVHTQRTYRLEIACEQRARAPTDALRIPPLPVHERVRWHRQLFTRALGVLGIEWRRMTEYDVAVSGRSSVKRLDEFFGPKS